MNFSRPQQWLTLGFGVVLTTLLGTALLAYQAIINRGYSSAIVATEESGYLYLNELLVAIAEAEVSHQTYLETGDLDKQRESYVFLEIANSYLEELNETDLNGEELNGEELNETELNEIDLNETGLDEEDYWIEEEALAPLKAALKNRVDILEKDINQPDTVSQSQPAQLETARQSSKAQLEVHLALQDLFEIGSIDQEWAIADASLSTNNELWILGLAVGISAIASSVLYLWLSKTLRHNQQIYTDLQHEKETLADTLKTETAHLHSTKAALAEELNRRQAIETTYKEIEQAKELTDIKLNFFSLASHELRTPLSAILVSAQLLDNPKAQRSEEKRSRNLKRIQSSAKTMTQLLADILLLTRAEAGKLEFNPQTIELHAFCSRLVEDVKFNTQAQHHISVAQQGECTVAHLDESLLRAMLMSLLTNAIKYSPQESNIQLNIIGKEGHTCFQLTDQGIGIPAADQTQLFESFHRGENTKTIAGTGLGLAVVKKCLDFHGGSIKVDSEVGVGTTFTIDLPWVDAL